MSQANVHLYEGLFLVNQSNTPDLAAALDHVRDILTRAEAEILVLSKWDERKLAYPIKGQKRGLYLLSYFKARASQVANIDRDCNLSEQILRSLLLRADHIGDAELDQARRQAEQTAVEAHLRTRQAPAGAEAAETGDQPEDHELSEETAPTADEPVVP